MDKKDNIFNSEGNVSPFEFNETVASVFDDMITRSVPHYREIIELQSRLTAKFYQSGTKIYDLGCSNGNFTAAFISEMGKKDFQLIAIDNSAPMLEFFKSRISGFIGYERVTPVLSDIMDISFEKSSVVIANLTLQFIPVEHREILIKRIYDSLEPGGIFLITEKTINTDSGLSDLQQEFYYRLKEENGYSKIEITRKREALENVLIPETIEAHTERLKNAGFSAIEIWFKWFHFAAFVCRKK
ncbi:MAG TPA: carboxy-S-adenosyl-L-methionine synthase CmoA [Spirochaetota bacterium]|nr:carboxy-S-adenosyl-L-methionine synthase CmoA [Spirochaetota bacterium]HPS87073.1 carboxy-S-adenosyl-L-methionine synthase CmoA [Spirochaetota bacterium]